MSARTREYDSRVARVLTDAGARIVGRGTDGNGHRTVTLHHHGHERTFHYPCSGTGHGHGIRNMQQRLKWLLNEIAQAAPVEAPPAPIHIPTMIERFAAGTAPEPSPATNPRLNKLRRSAIVKRYCNPLVSIDTIMREFGLSHKTAETLLMATSGAVRTKYERERNVRRARATKFFRPPLLILPPESPRRALTADDKRRIYVLKHYGMRAKELATMFDITESYIYTIVHGEKKRDIR